MISQCVVRKLIPQFIDSANNCFDRCQQRVVGFVLFAADVLVLRQVLAVSVIRSGIVPGRLIHTIMVVVSSCFAFKSHTKTFHIAHLMSVPVV